MAEDITVDLSPQPFSGDGITITPLPDGGMDVILDSGAGALSAPAMGGLEDDFGANLAEQLDPSTLAGIGAQIIEWVEQDEEARKGWWQRLEAGLAKCGLVDAKGDTSSDASIKGAATVIHPLLTEAAVQFQARALEELFPSAGPVKATAVGQATPQVQEQADRVADYMNYQMVYQDDSYFWDVDQMLFYLPWGGSAFKKTYWDPLRKMVMSRFVKAGDIIVPYGAQRGSEPRITHRFKITHNELLKQQRAGFYRQGVIQPSSDPGTPTLIDRADDSEPGSATYLESDHTLAECHCEYELPGIDQDGDYQGIAWPYIITVDIETQEVLGIRRNWRKADEANRKARRWFSQYRYLPGFGYYGYGLLHAIGGLGDAATAALRALLDAASAANMQGGFIASDVDMPGGEMVIEWGKYKKVNATSEELQKAFFTPPFKEPSEALFKVLGLLIESGQRFASTTEAMVGEGANNVPVGTTVARIEQGSKVYTGIHRRLHKAAGEEFKLRAELNSEHVPQEGYPYASGGKSREIFQADFDDRVDVEPVSDPNIFSSTQRIAIAQAQLQLAQSAPGMYDAYEVHKSMLRALRSPDIDTILIDPSKIEPADPVSEGQLVMVGKPIRAFPEQAHEAHIAIHMAQMQMFQGTPMAQQILPVMLAHMAEHFALMYRLQTMQLIGLPLPDALGERQKLPMEVENQIAIRVAQALAQVQAQMQAQQAAQPNPEDEAARADIRRKDEVAKSDIQRKDAIARAELERKARADQAETARADEEKRVADAEAFIKQAGAQGIEPRVLAQAAQETGLDLQATLDLIMRTRASGQKQGQPMPNIEGGR